MSEKKNNSATGQRAYCKIRELSGYSLTDVNAYLASESRLLVASIDFGTTYSGWALSFKHEFETDPKKVSTKNWSGPAMMTPKAPTTVLIKPDGETFDSFGYDAESKYEELSPEEAKRWFYFRRFKMMLHGMKIDRTLSLSDETNKRLPARTVFSHSIRFLKDDMLKTINDRLTKGEIVDKDILWVLTVPAIWDNAAKQFMREAAAEAGIQDKNLKIALEPEAASVFCHLIPLEKNDLGMSPLKPGGTVDITVHEVQSDGKLKEVYQATGGGWGGTKVDEAFEQSIIELVGDSVFKHFCRENSSDHLTMLRDFEVKKRKISPGDKGERGEEEGDKPTVFIRVPMSLREIYEEETGDMFRKAFNQGRHHGNMSLDRDKLILPLSTMWGFFSNPIQDIVSHVKKLMENDRVRDISTILMVGGFSESKMLQDAILTNFTKVKTVIPPEPGLVVLKGAVVYGHDPSIVSKRMCRYTYGVNMTVDFDYGKHDKEKLVFCDNRAKCADIFNKHVEIGQTVTFNEIQSHKYYFPVTDAQTEIVFFIYGSTKKSPMYVTDEGCVKLGTVSVDITDRSVPKEERQVQVSMTFSGTEIDVTAREIRTGKSTKVSVDFLDMK